MSTRSSPQTTTTTSEPPKYLQPYLQRGAQDASTMYSNGGAPLVGFDPAQIQAQELAIQRATGGSPVNNAAQDYATKTLQGGFMGKNPWLDQTFNRAAGAVTNQMQSHFGLAGRNPRGVDAAGYAGEQYNDLAAQIYGGDYQAERGRQQQLVPFAGQVAQQDYNDIGMLANVGAERQGMAQAHADQPGMNLDAYLARLQGIPGGTVTQQTPMERNILGGMLGGGMLGGSLFPGWGAIPGAVLGGILG